MIENLTTAESYESRLDILFISSIFFSFFFLHTYLGDTFGACLGVISSVRDLSRRRFNLKMKEAIKLNKVRLCRTANGYSYA